MEERPAKAMQRAKAEAKATRLRDRLLLLRPGHANLVEAPTMQGATAS